MQIVESFTSRYNLSFISVREIVCLQEMFCYDYANVELAAHKSLIPVACNFKSVYHMLLFGNMFSELVKQFVISNA